MAAFRRASGQPRGGGVSSSVLVARALAFRSGDLIPDHEDHAEAFAVVGVESVN
jgi:hypothetical protein